MRRHLIVPVVALVGVLVACVPPDPGPSTTTSTTTTSTTTTLPGPTVQQESLDAAAAWVLGQFDTTGVMPNVWSPEFPDHGNGVLAVANLDALGVGGATSSVRYEALLDAKESYIDEGAGDRPGALARVIMAVVAHGDDPRDVRGSDLVARLEATQQPNGLYGTQYAAFDGAFRQGLALAALSLVSPRPASIDAGAAWLVDQQCDDGSWMMYRAATTGDCVENPAMWQFKDSNGSALAVLGLSAVGVAADVDPASWFTSVRGDDGGWGTSPAGPTQESDADSTGLVIGALESLGDPIPTSAWDALLAFQGVNDAVPANQGAYAWKLTLPEPNRLATMDAMVALFDEVWPAALAG